MSPGPGGVRRYRVAIVGAGFGGLGTAIRLRRAGIEDFVILERAAEVGGTWRDNTYPGCQCDVPSHLYSLSFAPNADWSRSYSRQPEIQEYLRRTAREEGVYPHVRFGEELCEAAWDEPGRVWRIRTTTGELEARVLVGATGPLSEPSMPALPGLGSFEGAAFHTAAWRHDVPLDGKRVAVVGTGSSAIQLVPEIQPRVARLLLFQRTPPWVLPHPDFAMPAAARRILASVPLARRALRAAIYAGRELYVLGFCMDTRLMKLAERLGRRHLARQVPDPELRAKLAPNFVIGCKRILLSNAYYPALASPTSEVVTERIAEVRRRAIVTADGVERPVDVIVLATGFLVTEHPSSARIRGREGRTLAEHWDGSPASYLGTSVSGFPNLFMLLGPNTGTGHTSVVLMMEAQIAHLMGALAAMEREGIAAVDVRPEVQARFNDRVQTAMRRTVWTSGGCSSWYLDRTGRNTTLWPGFTFSFQRAARRFRLEDYAATPS